MRGCLGRAPADRLAPWSPDQAAGERLSPRKNPSAPSLCSTSGPKSRSPRRADLQLRTSALQGAVSDRGGPVRQRVAVGDLRDGQPSPHGQPGRTRRRKGDANASGCTAEQMSWTTPENSGSGRVRAPPPSVGWASITRTERPARAQMTAAARPLGPLPTTVTSTPANLPLATPSFKPISLAG